MADGQQQDSRLMFVDHFYLVVERAACMFLLASLPAKVPCFWASLVFSIASFIRANLRIEDPDSVTSFAAYARLLGPIYFLENFAVILVDSYFVIQSTTPVSMAAAIFTVTTFYFAAPILVAATAMTNNMNPRFQEGIEKRMENDNSGVEDEFQPESHKEKTAEAAESLTMKGKVSGEEATALLETDNDSDRALECCNSGVAEGGFVHLENENVLNSQESLAGDQTHDPLSLDNGIHEATDYPMINNQVRDLKESTEPGTVELKSDEKDEVKAPSSSWLQEKNDLMMELERAESKFEFHRFHVRSYHKFINQLMDERHDLCVKQNQLMDERRDLFVKIEASIAELKQVLSRCANYLSDSVDSSEDTDSEDSIDSNSLDCESESLYSKLSMVTSQRDNYSRMIDCLYKIIGEANNSRRDLIEKLHNETSCASYYKACCQEYSENQAILELENAQLKGKNNLLSQEIEPLSKEMEKLKAKCQALELEKADLNTKLRGAEQLCRIYRRALHEPHES